MTLSRPWDRDEIAWARECFLAGDTFEEIGEAADRPLDDVRALLGSGARITPYEREILSLYSAGCTFPEIAVATNRSSKAAGAAITKLRAKGLAIPYHNAAIAAAKRGICAR